MYNYMRDTHGDKDFLGERTKNEDGTLTKIYEWQSYNEVYKEADTFGSGLRNLGLCPMTKEFRDIEVQFLSIFAPNVKRWYTMDIAAMLHGITLAPLYSTLGPKTLAYVLNQTKVKTLGLTVAKVPLIVEMKTKGELPHLETLLLMDDG